MPPIITAINLAARAGLHIPSMYNTGGYDSPAKLKLLDGIIDIYMPDMKYGDANIVLKYPRTPNCPSINQSEVIVMHRQVGNLQINPDGIATRGLLVRHLFLPNSLAGTQQVVEFLANRISIDTYLNLMNQYHPAYRAHLIPELNRPVRFDEFDQAIHITQAAGLHHFDKPLAKSFLLPIKEPIYHAKSFA